MRRSATTVTRVYVQQGDWAKAGQLLLQLQDADAQAQAARAEAQLRGAQADVNAVSERRYAGRNPKHTECSHKGADPIVTPRNVISQAMVKLQQNGAASPGEVDAARNQLKVAQS